MKTYSQKEKSEAQKELPRPLNDFLGSRTISNIYVGIQKKHQLNLRQLMLFSEIANITLIGLEPESALETNVHNWLPELSNTATKELVADINDRVFKEARRRLQENIVEPEPEWDEETLGPKEEFKKLLNSAQLKELVEKEAREGKKTEPPEVETGTTPPESETQPLQPTATQPALGNPAEEEVQKAPPVSPPTPPTKLQERTTAKPEEVAVEAPPAPKTDGASGRSRDPYRESIE